MNIRLVEWHSAIYIVIGIGYESFSDPPDVYHAIPLTNSIMKDIILNRNVISIPLSEAIEITDKNRVNAILVLFR